MEVSEGRKKWKNLLWEKARKGGKETYLPKKKKPQMEAPDRRTANGNPGMPEIGRRVGKDQTTISKEIKGHIRIIPGKEAIEEICSRLLRAPIKYRIAISTHHLQFSLLPYRHQQNDADTIRLYILLSF